MNNYKPISTAPTDGTPILTEKGVAHYSNYSWVLCDISGLDILTLSRRTCLCKPEQWTPIPSITSTANAHVEDRIGKIEQKVSELETKKTQVDAIFSKFCDGMACDDFFIIMVVTIALVTTIAAVHTFAV